MLSAGRAWLFLTVLVVCTLSSLYSLPPAAALPQANAPGQPAVLIIGSGISGLGAGHKLYAHGFRNVRVLEATGRTGGRIRSQRLGKGFVDIGAQWINGPSPSNPVFQLATQYSLLGPEALTKENQEGILFNPLPPISVAYSSSGEKISPEVVGKAKGLFLSFFENDESLNRGPNCDQNETVGSSVRAKVARGIKRWDSETAEVTLALLSSLLKTECIFSGTHSLDYLARCPLKESTLLPGRDCTFPRGFESLINQIKSQLPNDTILLNKAVKTVHWNGSYRGDDSRTLPVMVECEDGDTFVADHVIVTVPLGFLKERSSGFFSPSLSPQKAQTIQRMGFGTINKIWLEFKEPFWEPETKSILLAWDGESPLTNAQVNMTHEWVKKIPIFVVPQPPEQFGHVLYADITGEESKYMETLTDDEVLSNMTALLRQFTGNPNLSPPLRVVRSQWHSHPYIHGAHTYVPLGSSGKDFDVLARPLPDDIKADKPLQVLFAGEATHRYFYATTHGALLSGWREAERLMSRYPLDRIQL